MSNLTEQELIVKLDTAFDAVSSSEGMEEARQQIKEQLWKSFIVKSKITDKFIEEWLKMNWKPEWGEHASLGWLYGMLKNFANTLKESRQVEQSRIDEKATELFGWGAEPHTIEECKAFIKSIFVEFELV